MKIPESSIARLMLIAVLAAIGMAAIMNASAIWAGIAQVTVSFLLLASLVGAACCTGKGRATAVGYAVFAWGYLLLNAVPPQAGDSIADLPLFAQSLLFRMNLTRKLTPVPGQYADVKVHDSNRIRYVQVKVLGTDGLGQYTVLREDGFQEQRSKQEFRPDNEEFYLIVGKSLFHVLVGALGSALARFLHSRACS